MANRLRVLDPSSSPAALFGAQLRALRVRRGLSLAAVGRLVHVSGDLIGKIEKAERRPQLDLIARLDRALQADGELERLAVSILEDVVTPAAATTPTLSAEGALPVLRHVIDTTRAGDHAMMPPMGVSDLVAHAEAAERVHQRVDRAAQPRLLATIGEAYQLAGWLSFDQGRPVRAEKLLGVSRTWVERAADPALAAYVLGPNLSFVATCGGHPGLGVERAYGAIGWARRSGNHRLSGFAMAIGARAHARLGETALCLDLLEQAGSELDRHTPDERDEGWLSVFDRPALEGHRGSCLLDLGMPERAVGPLAEQDQTAPGQFVRNRVIWQLDRIDALLRLRELDRACTELLAATVTAAAPTTRVLHRFRALELRLRALPPTTLVRQALDQLRSLSAAHG